MAWFEMKSAKQVKAEAKAYKESIYPLGDEQMKWEEDILNELFSYRKDMSIIKYVLIADKDRKCKGDDDDEDDISLFTPSFSGKQWDKMLKRMNVNAEEMSIIELIVDIEEKAETLEDLPSIDKIKEMIEKERM